MTASIGAFQRISEVTNSTWTYTAVGGATALPGTPQDSIGLGGVACLEMGATTNSLVVGTFYSCGHTFATATNGVDFSDDDAGIMLHLRHDGVLTFYGYATNSDSVRIILTSDGGTTNYARYDFTGSGLNDGTWWPMRVEGNRTPDATGGTFNAADVTGIWVAIEARTTSGYSYQLAISQAVFWPTGGIVLEDSGGATTVDLEDYYNLLKPSGGQTYASMVMSKAAVAFESKAPITINSDDYENTDAATLLGFAEPDARGVLTPGAGYYSLTVVGQTSGSIVLGTFIAATNSATFDLTIDASAASTVISCASLLAAGLRNVIITGAGNTLVGTISGPATCDISDGDLTLTIDAPAVAVNVSADLITGSEITVTNAVGDSLTYDLDGADYSDWKTIVEASSVVNLNPTTTAAWDIDVETISGSVEFDNLSAQNIVATLAQNISRTVASPTTGGGTLTVNSPVDTFTITSSEASSLIQIFTTGTQTVLSSTTGNSLAFNHSGQTVDYVVQKAGFLPQRFTNEPLSGTNGVSVNLLSDPVYNSSHGLTFTTDYSYNATTRVMTIVAAQQGRDLYSAMIDDFISESALFNRPFPLVAIGIDRIDFTSDGTTASTIDAGDIQFWRGAGMEWEHATTGNKTHKYCSVIGTGTNAAGTKGYIQQVDGAAPSAITLVSNNINQVVQYYSDPNGDGSTADGYNYSGHLVVKLFNDGYYQASADILTAYDISAIESFEYVIPMQMTSTGLGTGTRGVTITVVDNASTPVEEQSGYFFDYKVEGGASDSPEDLLRQWIYDVYTDPTASTYASKINFNWPDPILESGGSYETQVGIVYGESTTTDLHGFYVEEGTDYHPDFLRQESNTPDSYFVTPIFATAEVTGMPTTGANIRLQITNVTAISASAWAGTTAYSAGDKVLRSTGVGTEQTAGLYFVATTAGTTSGSEPTWDTVVGNTTVDGTVTWTCYAVLFYDGDPASSAYSANYNEGEEFSSGDTYRVRFAQLNGATTFATFNTTGIAASTGFSVAVSVDADSVYSDNAVNGSSAAVTAKFTADYTNDELDLDANQDFSLEEAYAYYCYELTTSQGMYEWWGGVTAIDSANYRNNTAVVSMYFDETAGFVKQTGSGRWYRDDDTRPARDPTTGAAGLEINWKNPVYLQATGSAVLAQDIVDIADAVGNKTIETGYTLVESMRLQNAVLMGKTSGGPGSTVFRDINDTKDRVTSTADTSGNRTAITLDET